MESDFHASPAPPAPPAATSAPRASMLCPLAALALAVAYFFVLHGHFAPAISTPDANGYFAQARHVAERGATYFDVESPLQFVPPHWVTDDGVRYYCKYPPGLPLGAAALRRIAGPEASLTLNLFLAALTLLGVFAVARRWSDGGSALVAAAGVALMPTVNQQAQFAFSHTAVAFLLIWGVYAAARWQAGGRAGWILIAGLLFGAIPTVRYPEALFVVALGVFVLFNLRAARSAIASLTAAAVGVAAPLGALLVRNQLAFGAFWRTGYASSNEQTGFGWSYFVEHAVPYLESLQGDGAGPLVGLALAGLAALVAQRGTRSRGVLLLTLVGPITLLYMAYYWGSGQGAMRFFVPVFLVLAVAAAYTLHLIGRANRAAGIGAGVGVLLYMIAWGVPSSLQMMDQLRRTNAALATATRQVQAAAPRGAVLVADRELAQQLDFVGGWRLVDESLFLPGGGPRGLGGGAPAGAADDENAPSPMAGNGREKTLAPFEALSDRERREALAAELRKWAAAGDQKVYWIGAADRLETIRLRFAALGEARTLVTFELPPDDRSAGPGRGGRGPGLRGGPRGGGRLGGFGGPGTGAGGGAGGPGFMGGPLGGPPGMGGPPGGPPGGGPLGGGAYARGGKFVIVAWDLRAADAAGRQTQVARRGFAFATG